MSGKLAKPTRGRLPAPSNNVVLFPLEAHRCGKDVCRKIYLIQDAIDVAEEMGGEPNAIKIRDGFIAIYREGIAEITNGWTKFYLDSVAAEVADRERPCRAGKLRNSLPAEPPSAEVIKVKFRKPKRRTARTETNRAAPT